MSALPAKADSLHSTVEHFEVYAFDLELDDGEPWRVEPFFSLFLEDYFAEIPENWLLVPEANSKTSLAGLANYLLEHRRRAAIPWAASTRDQAEIGFRQAEGFTIGSPRLRKLFKCQGGYRKIEDLMSGGVMQIFAADDGHGDGIIPTDAFLDELHRHKNLRLYRTWRGKLIKRGGQMATISTAGEPGSEFEETRERIRQETKVIDIQPGFMRCRSDLISLHEYAIPEGADMDDMEQVKLANPFTGITPEILATKHASPTMTPAHWARFVCNVPTREVSAAIQEREWHLGASTETIPEGEPIWLGLDVAWKWDTTAAVPLWWRDSHFRLLGPAHILVPPRDGTSMHPSIVERELTLIHERNPLHTVVMDVSKAEQLSIWISDELGATVIDRQQTNPFAVNDYNRFMEALREGWLWHSGDAGLTRHALNAVTRILPQGDARFDRPSSVRIGGQQEARVIDALTAAAMVHAMAAMVGDAPEVLVSYG